MTANRAAFGTSDGYPGDHHREMIFKQIKPGGHVGILTQHGQLQVGRVVMKGPAGWVLNLGGTHGTPGIADATNTVYVSGAKI